MAAATTVAAALAGIRTTLQARPALAGVAVHTVDLGWSENEAIVLTRVDAPQGWLAIGQLATKEDVTVSGYIFVGLAGSAGDDDALAAQARAAVLENEVAQQLREDGSFGGVIPLAQRRLPPRLGQVSWRTWLAEVDQVGIARVRIDWTIVWQARV
jgi:hypothetical protein